MALHGDVPHTLVRWPQAFHPKQVCSLAVASFSFSFIDDFATKCVIVIFGVTILILDIMVWTGFAHQCCDIEIFGCGGTHDIEAFLHVIAFGNAANICSNDLH